MAMKTLAKVFSWEEVWIWRLPDNRGVSSLGSEFEDELALDFGPAPFLLGLPIPIDSIAEF